MFKTIISIASVWIILLPLITGAMVYKRIGYDSKLILAVVATGTFPQMIHFFLPDSEAEFISYNLYSPIEYYVFFLLFYSKISTSKIKKLYWVACSVYVIIMLCIILKSGIRDHFISQWDLLNNFSYLIWIGLYFYQAFEFDKGELIKTNSFFWYTIGIFVYATCTTVVYSLWQKILSSPENSTFKYLRCIHSFFNIIMYVLFTIGLVIDNTFKKKLGGDKELII